MNKRQEFLQYFFNDISGYRYVILKNTYDDIYQLPESADIDLVIDKNELPAILGIIRRGKHVMRIKTDNKNFVCFVGIFFEDMSYLEIDLIHRFDRKGIIYMDAGEVLSQGILSSQGLKIAAPHHQFEYILLFYLLNHSEIPLKYREYFSAFEKEERSIIFTHFTHKYDVHINTLEDLYAYHKRHKKKMMDKINNYAANKWFRKLLSKSQYLFDVIKEKWQQRGITITFSGVDGAGKSTILENVKEILQRKYHRDIKVLRHRPSLLPILSSVKHGKKSAEQKAASSLPRQGKNDNFFSSLFRFLYYYADYLFGQIYIFFRYKIKGTTVLYDRYYFDFIIDARRSNISLNRSFLRFGYLFISKPRVNFFLYAPEKEILLRKQELSEHDIRTMTDDYLHLFLDFSGSYKNQAYVTINNTDIKRTIDTVMKHIISA